MESTAMYLFELTCFMFVNVYVARCLVYLSLTVCVDSEIKEG